ncbi:MAG: fluoride efflux transporter CrcB [Tahibacter sp.]
MNWIAFLAIGVGAAFGAWLRWGLSLWLNPLFPLLPLGTLTANLVGGLLMGLAMGITAEIASLSPEVRLLVTTGFLGGLTTFSTFSGETANLLVRHDYGWSAVLILAHLLGSVSLTLAGLWLSRLLLRA